MNHNINVFVTLSKVNSTYSVDRYLTIKVDNIYDQLPKNLVDRLKIEKDILIKMKEELNSRLVFKFYYTKIKQQNVLRFKMMNNIDHKEKGLIATVNQVMNILNSLYSSVIFCEKDFFRFKDEEIMYDCPGYSSDSSEESKPIKKYRPLLNKFLKYKRENKIETPYPVNEIFLDSLF